MSFSRIIIQLLKTLNPLSTFRIVFRYDFINEHSWSPSTSPEGSDGNHNHTFLPRKRRNHVRTSLLIKFTRRIRLLAIIEEIQRSLIISNATLLITDGRLDFHFHTVFLSDTPPSIYNANPRLMTPPRSVTRELLKKWLNSEKTRVPKMSVQHWPIFGVTRTGLKIMHPKSGFRLVLLTDPDWLQKIAKKNICPAKKMLAWDGDIWLEVTDIELTFFLASNKSRLSMVWPIPNIDGTDRARPAMGDSGLGEQTFIFWLSHWWWWWWGT